MTSRNLFFKLMKEDLKRRLWAIGFSVLALFFAMPMAAAMGIGEIGNQYKQWLISGTGYENMVPEALRQTKILRLAGEILGFENYALFMVVGAAAMILGLTGFLYLHSKKQIDFYNSLPVKREMLFTVKFLDGFLIILAAYLINMFAAFGIFCGNGIAAGDLFKMMFASFAVNMIGFRGASHRESLYLDPRRRRPVRIFAGGLPADRGLKIPVLCDTGKRRRCVLACKIRFPHRLFHKTGRRGA